MLINLHVKNLALIDEIEVFFNDHLNILTGETGAGKSILIGSVNAALGAKISKDMIRKGADYALVELLFQIEDKKILESIKKHDIIIEDDGQINISRKIMNGRSISKINGENVTSQTLKEIAGLLIDIHGQHEHQSLLYKSKHLEILDHFAKGKIGNIKDNVIKYFEKYTKEKAKLEESTLDEEKRLREMSFLEYEIEEIEGAKLIIGEDEEIGNYYKKLINANKIMEVLTDVYEKTGYDNMNSSGDAIGRAVKSLGKISDIDNEFMEFKTQLEEVEGLLNDFNRDISNYISNIQLDEGELKRTEERMNLINNLKAKYGNTIKEIIDYKSSCEEKLQQLKDYDNYINELNKKLAESENKLKELSEKLSNIRKKESKELTKKIKEALIDLNFLDVQFKMEFNILSKYTKNGTDEGEFIISTNPGEELKPLSKVASGGELSRIMLAIKSVLADNDAIDTLIFDEIDVGISGRTAQKVSEKLSLIAKNHQVIAITHLAQIAAMADAHYIIEKNTNNNKTITSIRQLKDKETTAELARILGGAKITDTVLKSAIEMKELAQSTKNYQT